MKVLSLFDGMACGLTALKRAGKTVTEYHAFEIDKYAIQVATKNHPEIIQHGEITEDTDFTQFKGFDLVIGGSPCQGFSFAGKQLAFDDPRSKLFFQFVRAVKESECKFFMLENVRMKKEFLDVISDQLGVEPVCINSALVSAQNRVRYYWCNWEVSQPEDKGIFLADIIEEGVVDRDKSYCIDANYWKGGNLKSYLEKKRRQLVFSPATILGRRLNERGVREDYNKNIPTTQCLEVRGGDKIACLTTVRKDTVISILPKGRYPDVFNKLEKGIHYRYLTPIECERLQTLIECEREFTISTCSDPQKNHVNVEGQNHKSQKPVLSAERTEYPNLAKSAEQNLWLKSQRTKEPVPESVQVYCGEKELALLFYKAKPLRVRIAEVQKTFPKVKRVEDFAHLLVFMSLTAEKITLTGEGESLLKNNSLAVLKSGANAVNLFGKGIKHLAEDAERNLTTINKLLKSIISNPSQVEKNEQNFQTLSSFVAHVILGYIPQEIDPENILKINVSLRVGYTFDVSNSSRYKMLGNGWTVDVIKHIFEENLGI